MAHQGPVLAATAFDSGSDEAVRQAADWARDEKAPLVVCHVLPELYGFRPLFPQMLELDREHANKVRVRAERLVHEQVDRVVRESPQPKVVLEAGSPHSEVLRVAEESGARLIVVGVGSAQEGASLGGVAERIVRHAHCPVLIAVQHPGEVVLAATDFSDSALPAVRVGYAEARRRGLRLAVLHAIDLVVTALDAPEGGASMSLPYVLDARRAKARGGLDQIARDLGPGVETILCEGRGADAILEHAESMNAALVVIGTHGRTGLSRLALGSVAEEVVRRTRRSLLVVRLERR